MSSSNALSKETTKVHLSCCGNKYNVHLCLVPAFQNNKAKTCSNLHAFIFCYSLKRKCCCKNKTQKEKNTATDNATKVVLVSKILLNCKVNDYS